MMSETVHSETPTSAAPSAESLEHTDDHVGLIKSLLREGELVAAKEAAARAAALFPDHPWLTKSDRVLSPRGVKVGGGELPRRDRDKELAWLRRHGDEYRGKWVALDGEKLVASGDRFDDVLEVVRRGGSELQPLVHRVD